MITPENPARGMKPNLRKKAELHASVIIGAVSGPFLFKAAGISDFPRFQISHYLIMICYVTGMIVISKFLIGKMLGVVTTKTE